MKVEYRLGSVPLKRDQVEALLKEKEALGSSSNLAAVHRRAWAISSAVGATVAWANTETGMPAAATTQSRTRMFMGSRPFDLPDELPCSFRRWRALVAHDD
jgi:hypothetical protein